MVSEGYFKRKCASLHKFPQGTLFLYKEKKNWHWKHSGIWTWKGFFSSKRRQWNPTKSVYFAVKSGPVPCSLVGEQSKPLVTEMKHSYSTLMEIPAPCRLTAKGEAKRIPLNIQPLCYTWSQRPNTFLSFSDHSGNFLHYLTPLSHPLTL